MGEFQLDNQLLEENLRKVISRSSAVINEMKSSKSWEIILEDFNKTKTTIDDNWHLVDDEKKLKELRVTKMAIMSILNTLSNYEHDKVEAEKQLYALEHPDKVQTSDYDGD